VQPQPNEPAHTFALIVDWYAARPRTGLWVLLIALPCTVMVTGCGTLLRSWSHEAELRQVTRQTLTAIRAHLATLLIAVATLAASGFLTIVTLHVITD